MSAFELLRFPGADELAREAARALIERIGSRGSGADSFGVALSGGRIAHRFFASIVDQSKLGRASFAKVHFFWADERCVPPTDSDSNFRVARELLLSPLNIPDPQIHRIRGEENPENAAASAEDEIRLQCPPNEEGQPVLDLVILGMGEDGHVASLFPGEPETMVLDARVFRPIKNSPKPPPNRVTLGYQAIAAARNVWVLVSGAGKDTAFKESLSPAGRTPLARVLKLRPRTQIWTDLAE